MLNQILVSVQCCAVLYVIPAYSASSPNTTLFHTTSQKLNQESAEELCRGFGEEWSLPNYQISQQELGKYMKLHQIKSAWLGIKKENLPSWTWVNNISDDTVVVKTRGTGSSVIMPCAAMDVGQETLNSISCGHQGVGFVCQMPKGKTCPEAFHRNSCFRKADTWYIIACNSRNWYNARSYCLTKGGDLAVLDTPKKRTDVINAIISRRLAGECSWVFLGLKKEKWLLTRTCNHTQVTNGSLDCHIQHMKWTIDEPRSKHVCVKLSVSSEHGGWTTDDCLNINPVVCQNYGQGALEMAYPTKEVAKQVIHQAANTEWIAGVTGLAAVLFLLVAVLLVRYFFITYKKHKERKSNNEENYPLLLKPKSFDGITVVMFSEGIDKQSLEQNDVILEGKPQWRHRTQENSGTRTANRIINGFKNVIQQKHIPSKMVKIINMQPLKGRELSTDFADSAAICSETPRVIVYVPEIESPASKKTLKSLSTLRKKYVCITAAKRSHNEVSAAECIAVGVEHYTDDMITSGVLDFVLDSSECEGCKSFEDGVSTAVGIIGGFLHELQSVDDRVKCEVFQTRSVRHLLIKLMHKNKMNETDEGKINVLPSSNNNDGGGGEASQTAKNVNDLENHTLSGFGHLTRKVVTNLQKDEINEILEEIRMLNNGEGGSNSNNKPQDSDKPDSSTSNIINIAVAATPFDEHPKDKTFDIPIEFYKKKDTSSDTTHTYRHQIAPAISSFQKEFEKYGIDFNKVKIHEVPVYSEKNLMDWYNWRKLLQDNLPGNGNTPNIMFLASVKRIPPVGMRIQHTIRNLKKKCIVVTDAIGLRGPGGPTAFPSDSVIAVAPSNGGPLKDGPCGSTVDYLMESENRWTAAMKVIAVAAVVLIKAQDNGIQGKQFEQLCSTNIMHNILREMCEHPSEHKLDEGYGKMNASAILKDEGKLISLIQKYLNKDTITDIWSGKTI